MEPLLVRPVENQLREAELDRDFSRFFLGQSIGINSGERFDKGALAVIDVTGGCENEMFFRHLKLVEARPSVRAPTGKRFDWRTPRESRRPRRHLVAGKLCADRV